MEEREVTVNQTKSAVFGFTGTSKGMAPRQMKVVRHLLWRAQVLHLGDYVGADAQAYDEARCLDIKTIGHPPSNGSRRAFCEYDEEREPKPYLERNRDIVTEGVGGLIAAPKGWVEELRSGTWATIRYARKARRRIWIVRPDGTTIEE